MFYSKFKISIAGSVLIHLLFVLSTVFSNGVRNQGLFKTASPVNSDNSGATLIRLTFFTQNKSIVQSKSFSNDEKIQPATQQKQQLATVPSFKSLPSLTLKDDLLPDLPTIYLTSADVDFRTEPIGDWVLDTELDIVGQNINLLLTVYVGADGVLDKFEINNSSLNEANTAKLVSNLSSTLFVPAIRFGRNVPSSREIEITVVKAFDTNVR